MHGWCEGEGRLLHDSEVFGSLLALICRGFGFVWSIGVALAASACVVGCVRVSVIEHRWLGTKPSGGSIWLRWQGGNLRCFNKVQAGVASFARGVR